MLVMTRNSLLLMEKWKALKELNLGLRVLQETF